MLVSEIFFSIQGESIYSGLPCVFIRAHGCNLRCHYCDTGYSKQEILKSEDIDSKKILNKINKFPHTHLAEISGGEPLLQSDIYELINLLDEHKFKILLETNGTIDLSQIPNYVCKIVDVKTPSSGYSDSFLITNLNHINPFQDNLKFVLSDFEDYEWMKIFLNKFHLYGHHILVSTAYEKIEPIKIAEKILTDGLNVRFQIQLHKYIGIK